MKSATSRKKNVKGQKKALQSRESVRVAPPLLHCHNNDKNCERSRSVQKEAWILFQKVRFILADIIWGTEYTGFLMGEDVVLTDDENWNDTCSLFPLFSLPISKSAFPTLFSRVFVEDIFYFSVTRLGIETTLVILCKDFINLNEEHV